MEDLLNGIVENENKDRLSIFYKLRLTLFALTILVSALNIAVCFITIPGSAVMTGPSMFAKWKVPYVLTGVILLLLPAICLSLSSLIGLIPFKVLTYKQRLSVIFLSLLLIIESIGLYQLLMQSY